MTRRGFIGMVASAVAAAAVLDVDPEKLLWEPGKKTFFIPEAPRIANNAEVLQAADERLLHYSVKDHAWKDGEAHRGLVITDEDIAEMRRQSRQITSRLGRTRVEIMTPTGIEAFRWDSRGQLMGGAKAAVRLAEVDNFIRTGRK